MNQALKEQTHKQPVDDFLAAEVSAYLEEEKNESIDQPDPESCEDEVKSSTVKSGTKKGNIQNV